MEQSGSSVILLVDDEPVILDIMKAAIEEAGFTTVLATDDETAFETIEGELAGRLAGLITDIRLGCPRTGWDIAHRARELNPDLAVIYVTGDSAHDWSANGVPHSTLVTKPFADAQLVVALAALLNKTDGR